MTIDLSKYTGGALSLDDYIFMLNKIKDDPDYIPTCPVVTKWVDQLWLRPDESGRTINYPYSDDFMRTLKDYGITTGIY